MLHYFIRCFKKLSLYIENSNKDLIEKLTEKRPCFFRSNTAYYMNRALKKSVLVCFRIMEGVAKLKENRFSFVRLSNVKDRLEHIP